MDDLDAQKMLDLYIHDYMVRKNMHTSADIFAREAEIIPNADAMNPQKEFFTDWCSIFLNAYNATAEAARHPQTQGASSSKVTRTAVNVSTNNPTVPRPRPRPRPYFGHMLPRYFNGRNKIRQIPSQELPSTSGENVAEEEPFDVGCFFNDNDNNPDDKSTLPHSSPARDKTEQSGLSFEEVASFQTNKTMLKCCDFSSSGKLLAAAGHDNKVLIWNLETLWKNIIKGYSYLITDIRFKPNSTIFATSSLDSSLQVCDAVKPEKISRLVGHAKAVTSLDFHPTRVNILCSCDSNYEIRLWDVNESSCIRAFKGANRHVRFRPQSGNLLAVASENVITMIDVETSTIQYQLEGHAKNILSMCWDTGGRYMASVSEDCARIWSIGTGGKSVHQLQSRENKFVSCTFHPVYSPVLAIGSNKWIQIWNPSDGSKTRNHRAHAGTVTALKNTSVNHRIASVSSDSWIKVWK